MMVSVGRSVGGNSYGGGGWNLGGANGSSSAAYCQLFLGCVSRMEMVEEYHNNHPTRDTIRRPKGRS